MPQYTFEISGQNLWAEKSIVQLYETPSKHIEDSRKEILIPVCLSDTTKNGQAQYVVDWSQCTPEVKKFLSQSNSKANFKAYLSSSEKFSIVNGMKHPRDVLSAQKINHF